MSCLLAGLAALLALAIPASIARASLVGAYLAIVLLAVLAVGAVVGRARGRQSGAGARRSGALVRIAGLAVAYAVAVTVINMAGGSH